MKSHLYLRLLSPGEPVNYNNPFLEQIKKQFSEVAVLDLDSESGELVLHFAQKMVQEASQLIVIIDSDTPDAAFGSAMPVVELILQQQENQLILFRRAHSRLLRMVQARPELRYNVAASDEVLLQTIAGFYTSEPGQE